MYRNAERKQITDTYHRMSRLLESKEWGQLVPNMYSMELKDEKAHRRGAPAGVRIPIPASHAAMYFVVKWIFEGLTSNLTADNVLDTRLAAMHGQAIARKYRALIVNEFTQAEIVKFSSLDYAAMASDE